MTYRLSTLEQKQFKKRMKIQEELGFPIFKEKIANDLIEFYNVEKEVASKLAFNPTINNLIIEDVSWAQHMGSRYWAEEIYELNLKR